MTDHHWLVFLLAYVASRDITRFFITILRER